MCDANKQRRLEVPSRKDIMRVWLEQQALFSRNQSIFVLHMYQSQIVESDRLED